MITAECELTPVIYNSAAIKLLSFRVPERDTECFRMHWHERMELIRVRTGKIYIDFGPVQEEYGPDTLVIFPPNQPHRGLCTDTPLAYDVISFEVYSFYNHTDVCNQYLPPILKGKSKFQHSTQNKEVLDCIAQILNIPATGLGALLMTAEMYKLIYLLYRNCMLEIRTVNAFDNTIGSVLEYIHENYASEMTTESLSARFRYAKPYFCRKFKECTGLTIMNYINIYRIETAYRMLKTAPMSISEVAEACGFPDANYFTRCFRQHFGHAPSYYKSEFMKKAPKDPADSKAAPEVIRKQH